MINLKKKKKKKKNVIRPEIFQKITCWLNSGYLVFIHIFFLKLSLHTLALSSFIYAYQIQLKGGRPFGSCWADKTPEIQQEHQ